MVVQGCLIDAHLLDPNILRLIVVYKRKVSPGRLQNLCSSFQVQQKIGYRSPNKTYRFFETLLHIKTLSQDSF